MLPKIHLLFHPAAAFALATATMPTARAQAPLPDSPAIERQANAMVARLSLEEKVDLLGGTDFMYVRAEPAVGLPKLRLSDGPMGVRTWGPSTAYAAGIALAAAWDPTLAERTGAAIGEDARARGVAILLGPGVNIYRSPLNGRNFEYFGEDPLLAARTAVGYIEGVQSRGVIATVKHFVANNSEYARKKASSDIDERTLREIYLPAFEAAVREAHVGAVMASYNRVNGVYPANSQWLGADLLKGEWGFDGIYMSDWHAAHDGVEAANAGLDLDMPRGESMNRETLLPAIKAGTVLVAAIDDKVRRIFRTALRFGFLDRDQTDLAIPPYDQQDRPVALEGARASIVLLKNQDAVLPLDPERVHTLAVIGPDAWPAVAEAGGSGNVVAFDPTSILKAVSDFVGRGGRVLYSPGLPAPADVYYNSVFDPAGPNGAIRVEAFANADFSGPPTSVKYEERANQAKNNVGDAKSVRFTAHFTPPKRGDYLFLAQAKGSDTYVLYVDGREVIHQYRRESQAPAFASVGLEGGKTVEVRLDFVPGDEGDMARFGVVAADAVVPANVKKIAAMADAALVCVGFNSDLEGGGDNFSGGEGESYDRTFSLPFGQDVLIKAVAAANPKTVVTVTSGGGFDSRAWLPDVPALIENWYLGQEGARALTEILFGLRSPEGKLPITMENSWADNPVHDHYYPEGGMTSADPHVKYAEGVFVGYRYYTTSGCRPLFPFGFGLSYTTFAFSKLSVPATGDSDQGVTVTVEVSNTGPRAGAEVVQLYVGDPSARVPRPVKELKAFEKIRLEPGMSHRVKFHLGRRAFAYFDSTAHRWRVDPGRFVLYVGDSSEATPLTAEVRLDR